MMEKIKNNEKEREVVALDLLDTRHATIHFVIIKTITQQCWFQFGASSPLLSIIAFYRCYYINHPLEG